MNERRSPLAAMLDLFVYTPVGLAVTVGEELPKLAAKGRAKVGPQVSTARVVGQFAVAEGRRRATRLVDPPTPTPPAPARPVPSPPAEAATASVPLRPVPDPPAPPARPDPSPAGPQAAAPRPATPPTRAQASRPPTASSRPAGGRTGGAAAPSPDGLAIPGYDSLSASQVVQRLAGLSSAELAAVGTYEAATRGRRTILARVTQLQNA